MNVLNRVPVVIAVAVAANFSVAGVSAQSPANQPPAAQTPPSTTADTPTLGAEKRIEGQVKSINPAGTEITLTDGTTLVTPAGATIEPGILSEGSTIVASYREQNGNNVLIELAMREPAASPQTAPAPRPSSAPRY